MPKRSGGDARGATRRTFSFCAMRFRMLVGGVGGTEAPSPNMPIWFSRSGEPYAPGDDMAVVRRRDARFGNPARSSGGSEAVRGMFRAVGPILTWS